MFDLYGIAAPYTKEDLREAIESSEKRQEE